MKCKKCICLTFCIRGNPKCVVLQTVKTQLWHFIRVYTVCEGEKDLQTKNPIFLKNYKLTPLMYTQWTIQSLLYQTTRRKNPVVYKGLKVTM